MLVNCFLLWLVHCKGVQLSQLHQQSCWAAAWLVHCKGVQLSQLHQQSCWVATWLVHFLLWQAAKPSGDKCTP